VSLVVLFWLDKKAPQLHLKGREKSTVELAHQKDTQFKKDMNLN
jgi:hypothetical protein